MVFVLGSKYDVAVKNNNNNKTHTKWFELTFSGS